MRPRCVGQRWRERETEAKWKERFVGIKSGGNAPRRFAHGTVVAVNSAHVRPLNECGKLRTGLTDFIRRKTN